MIYWQVRVNRLCIIYTSQFGQINNHLRTCSPYGSLADLDLMKLRELFSTKSMFQINRFELLLNWARDRDFVSENFQSQGPSPEFVWPAGHFRIVESRNPTSRKFKTTSQTWTPDCKISSFGRV